MASLLPVLRRSAPAARAFASPGRPSLRQGCVSIILYSSGHGHHRAASAAFYWKVSDPIHTIRFLSTTSSAESQKSQDDDSKINTVEAEFTEKETTPTATTEAETVQSATAADEPMKKTNVESMEFQAETKQLLDIVTHSLYTDKDVFLRELISNASDALEKLRHLQTTQGVDTIDKDVPLEIRISTDEVKSSITITDTGIGMTKEDMISNLGTIARSGSKNFLNKLKEQAGNSIDAAAFEISQGIIGKFGVGFYSAFMVGNKVEVRSKSALAEHSDHPARVWSSDDGTSSFEIADMDTNVRQERGSSVVIYLKEDFWDYCSESKLEEILKKYSNFVNFPIFLNGRRVNTIDAIWAKDPKEVDQESYNNFYKYISNNVDDPLEVIHFRADAPIDVKALFFIPSFHSEKYGMGRMEPGVSLYSRKVLIEAKSPDILPDWMRFVKGVVDSEDLPLAISREKAQDSALITKLRKALVRKFVAHITKMAKKDNEKFVDEFYKEYGFFIKEGICQDHEFQGPLSKLLHFETSKNPHKKLSSLDDYISRMRPEQNDIYYLCAPTRDAAVNSPYLEAFEKAGVEVLFVYTAIEDFVMANLEKYEGRKLVSAERRDIDLGDLMKDKDKDESKDEKKDIYKADRTLTDDEALEFCLWFKKVLGDKKISTCTVTKRLQASPAIVTDHESGAVRRMMRLVDTQDGNRDYIPLPKQHVEVNPSHPVIVGIYDSIKKEPVLAKVLAEQVYDNCLIAAGLLDDGRTMLPRINDILMCLVNAAKGEDAASALKKEPESATANPETENPIENTEAVITPPPPESGSTEAEDKGTKQ